MTARSGGLLTGLCFAIFVSCATVLRAENEMRVFTDTSGRTIQGQLVTVKDDRVTIKGKDGGTVTLPANNFCSADIEYFKQHGLGSPAPAPALSPSSNGGWNEPAEFTAARERYKQMYEAAWAPLKQRYLQYLEQLRRTAATRGDVRTTTVLQAEMDGMSHATSVDISQAPPEVIHARENLQQEAYRALAPLRTNWVQGLERFKRGLGVKGDIAGMNAVQKELDEAMLNPLPGENQIVLWNIHNSHYNDRGTKKCNLILYSGANEVWRHDNLELPWEKDADVCQHVAVPEMPFDRIRVEILEYVNNGAGLAEIEYLKNGKNLARGAKATASGYWEKHKEHLPSAVTDGNTSSKVHQVGYWMLDNHKLGWIEVHLGEK